ncbi:DNA primase/helicase [Proteus phage PM 93]|uniref:DNA primase/helicase n=1 Tax=Proteus phage PM 93 TaxID=1560284 RepID=A0A0U2JDB6_9CAUD|nr:DNA primase/helicase [Proteus phage PM 93]ALS88295.1 DNA primase/helicase [Proteus phage PM 93]
MNDNLAERLEHLTNVLNALEQSRIDTKLPSSLFPTLRGLVVNAHHMRQAVMCSCQTSVVVELSDFGHRMQLVSSELLVDERTTTFISCVKDRDQGIYTGTEIMLKGDLATGRLVEPQARVKSFDTGVPKEQEVPELETTIEDNKQDEIEEF